MYDFNTPTAYSMQLDVQIGLQDGEWEYETIHVLETTTCQSIINYLKGKKEGKFKLTTRGVYSRGEDFETQGTISDKVPFVSGSKIQLRLAPVFKPDDIEKGTKILEGVRDIIKKRGGRTYKGLSRMFRIMDSEKDDHQLDMEELQLGLEKFGLSLDKDQTASLMRVIDSDHSGTISLNEFLRAIRGQLNATRLTVVRRAFDKFDVDNSGVIEMSDLISAGYTKKKDKTLKEFFDVFQVKQGYVDDKIEWFEFEEYYARVSANLDNDQHFVELIENAWDLDGRIYKKSTALSF